MADLQLDWTRNKKNHFLERLEANRTILIQLNPSDKTLAINTVRARVIRIAGQKVIETDLKKLLQEVNT
jgi:hypothetical protein